jgi:DNA-binding transcriptional MerR regulator
MPTDTGAGSTMASLPVTSEITENHSIQELPSDSTSEPIKIETESPPIAETPKEEIKPPEVKEPSVAAKFSAIAKKEKALLERERSFKEKESAFNAYEKLKADVKADPIKYLESIGLSYADITDFIINSSTSPESAKVKELENKIDNFKKEQEKAQADYQARLVENATTQFKSNIADHIEKNKDKYESLALDTKDNTELVFQVISQYWEETGGNNGGKTLDFDTACDYVEKQIEKDLEERAERLAKTKKYGNKFQKAVEKAVPEKPASISTMPETLSSRTHAITTGNIPAKRAMSDEESIEQAAKMIQWGR